MAEPRRWSTSPGLHVAAIGFISLGIVVVFLPMVPAALRIQLAVPLSVGGILFGGLSEVVCLLRRIVGDLDRLADRAERGEQSN